MPRFSISAAVICKDEKQHIKHMLNSIKHAVNEIVIVDTGSTDNTVDIIRETTPQATVGHFQWTNNFAEARNYAKSLCKGDWILSIDADERLATDINLHAIIENLDERFKAVAATLVMPTNRGIGFCMKLGKAIRLFANGPFEWRYPLHEIITPDIYAQGYTSVYIPAFKLYHVGYDCPAENFDAKNERNIACGETDKSEAGYTAFGKGMSFFHTDTNEAIRCFNKAVGDIDIPPRYKARSLYYLALATIKRDGHTANAIPIFKKAADAAKDYRLYELAEDCNDMVAYCTSHATNFNYIDPELLKTTINHYYASSYKYFQSFRKNIMMRYLDLACD